MLSSTVATNGERALVGHIVPEEQTGLVVGSIISQLGNALKTYDLGNLCVGMEVIEVVSVLLHGNK